MRPLLLLALAACAGDPSPPTKPSEDSAAPPPPPPPRERVTEAFQYFPPKLDLAFIVDDDDWQGALAPDLDAFVEALDARDVDYHLGVTSVYRAEDGTTGVLSALGVMRWGESSHEGAADFLRAAMLPIQAEGDTCGTLAAKSLFEQDTPEGPNKGFFRPESEIAFVVVSDEPDRSYAYQFDHNAFVAFMRILREDPADVSFHAITRPHDQAGQQFYKGVVEALDGCIQSLDEVPFLPALECVVDTIEPTNRFVLEKWADPETLTVTVHEPGLGEVELEHDEFTWDEGTRTVDLVDYYPRFSAVVEITYLEP